MLRQSPAQAPVSAYTQDHRPGFVPALGPAPQPLQAAAPARAHGPVRIAAGFPPPPTCAATLRSPAGGAAAAPATGGGANSSVGGQGAEGAPPRAVAASRPPDLTASVSWLRCSRSRLCARSSSRCLSVTSLSCRSRARSSEEGVFLAAAARGRWTLSRSNPQTPTPPLAETTLTLWPAAQLSAEVFVLLPQPLQLQFGLLRRHLQLGSPGSQG